MLKFKSANPYWAAFSSYQSFQTVEELNETVKRFVATYDLTDAIKAVLNTLKLHSKRTFIGVSWLYREEIARKAKVSLSSVKRAIKALQETGILTVHEQNHTKRGGQTHNVYVINPVFETPEGPANEPPSEQVLEGSNPVLATVSDVSASTHKNSHTNSNTSLNHLSIKKHEELKFIPNKFIDLMEPFYANDPEIIRERWKTVCVAAKRSCFGLKNASFETIGQAWNDVVKIYKRGKIRNDDSDGLGGYFYSVLSDYLLNEWLRSQI